MKRFTFKPENHQYFYNGFEVPSVSAINKVYNNYNFNESDAELGKRVHKLIYLYDKNKLDRKSLDELSEKYLDAWKNFKREYKIKKWDLIEIPLYSEKYNYGATPDRYSKLLNTVFDAKTGAPTKSWAFQLAAYSQVILETFNLKNLPLRKIVHLKPDKYKDGYQVTEYLHRIDWIFFQSAHNVYKVNNL